MSAQRQIQTKSTTWLAEECRLWVSMKQRCLAEVITLIQAGTPLQIELGGAWDQDEWAKFYVEFLDAEGNPVTY